MYKTEFSIFICRLSLSTFNLYPPSLIKLTTGGVRCADHATPPIRKSWHYFANNRRSLGRHISLADQSHGGFFLCLKLILCRSFITATNVFAFDLSTYFIS
jgi:hypothetical protein